MSYNPLSGKVAIVTGGSKGIGASTGTALVQLGAKVVMNYGRDSAIADKLVATLGHEKAHAVQADAGSISGVESLVQATVDKSGKIDMLIPNAGIPPMKNVEMATADDFEGAFDLNVKSLFFLVHTIIALSTTQNHASTVTGPYTLHCASKGAIDQLVRVLSKDLVARKGNLVNAVAPGPTATGLFYVNKGEQGLKMIAGLNPNNRIGNPEEADVIVFFCGEGARWGSRQTIRVNGGQA